MGYLGLWEWIYYTNGTNYSLSSILSQPRTCQRTCHRQHVIHPSMESDHIHTQMLDFTASEMLKMIFLMAQSFVLELIICQRDCTHLMCPTCSAQSGVCQSQSLQCNFRTPQEHSSAKTNEQHNLSQAENQSTFLYFLSISRFCGIIKKNLSSIIK